MSSNDRARPDQLPPTASRSTTPGWRDPRLWIGVAIVAASVLVGARVLATADDTVQVWVVADDVATGQRLTEDDLDVRRMRFADGDDLDRYFAVDDELPAELVVDRPIGAGELLPRSAIGADEDDDTVVVSLAVPPQLVPTGIGEGSVVDVFVLDSLTAGDPAGPGATASPRPSPGAGSGGPALDDVRVVAAAAPEEALAGGGDRQIEVAVPADDVAGFYALLDSVETPTIHVAQVD